MNNIEKISISDMGKSISSLREKDSPSVNTAVLTHYLNNMNNRVSGFYKKNAIGVLNKYISYRNKEGDSHLEFSDAIQQLLFEIENVPFKSSPTSFFNFIDLFAGVGGFRIAMQNIGGKCVFTSEWDKEAQKTYKVNFGEVPFGDITKQETKNFIPHNIDILCGGFPCQAFSIAGNRKGFADTRGTLFFDLEKIIELKRPKVIFLENVKNLQSHDGGNTFSVMLDVLKNKLKYEVYFEVLNSMTHANIPQNREMLFIVAFDPKQVKNFNNFTFPKPVQLTKSIHDFIEKDKKDDKYYYSTNHQYYKELSKTIKSRDTIYQWRRIYVRENKSNVCPTLTANMGTGGHNVPLILDNYGIRKLTPKECFAFQGYPVKKYILPNISSSKLYMQAGNSVTVPLIEKIAKQIFKVL